MRRGETSRCARGAATAVAGLVLTFSAAAEAGPAVGQFEIKTLSAEPGEIEFQSQNAYAIGNPRRKLARDADGDLVGDHNSLPRMRKALELEFGLTPFLKSRIGIEYEKERREDFDTARGAEGYDALKLDEYAAEVIWVAIPRKGDGVGLGVVVEYEHPAASEGARTLVAGPIFEAAHGPWSLSVSPMLVQFFGGERNDAGRRDEKMDFAYAAQIKHRWSDEIDLALEAYGTVERVGGRGGRSDEALLFGDFDQHRLGPIVYWNFTPGIAPMEGREATEISLGFGTLFGLNEDTPSTTLKLSMEMTF